jgi:hypothetical protein
MAYEASLLKAQQGLLCPCVFALHVGEAAMSPAGFNFDDFARKCARPRFPAHLNMLLCIGVCQRILAYPLSVASMTRHAANTASITNWTYCATRRFRGCCLQLGPGQRAYHGTREFAKRRTSGSISGSHK